ncbi:MAG: response regulator [Candidatus Desantisbacteria bacterium]
MAKKVLIADDEFHIRRIVADKISKAGHIVFTAENGQEAVDIAKKEKPDIILMDLMMPVLSGIEAIKILKQDSDMANIPILVLTAMEFGEDNDIAAVVGANNIITKPFSPKELLDVVNARIGEA